MMRRFPWRSPSSRGGGEGSQVVWRVSDEKLSIGDVGWARSKLEDEL